MTEHVIHEDYGPGFQNDSISRPAAAFGEHAAGTGSAMEAARDVCDLRSI